MSPLTGQGASFLSYKVGMLELIPTAIMSTRTISSCHSFKLAKALVRPVIYLLFPSTSVIYVHWRAWGLGF